jgi:DNA-binding HxlR family transcriptional regulator
VGERWALLISRDLSVRSRRYTDLLDGLAGIPTNVLSTRLKELEHSGIIERRVAPAPQRGVLYTPTPAGQVLEPAILSLGRLIQAAKRGLVELDGRREPLRTFTNVFACPQPA